MILIEDAVLVGPARRVVDGIDDEVESVRSGREPSLAVTLIESVPLKSWGGVPEKVRVAASKLEPGRQRSAAGERGRVAQRIAVDVEKCRRASW